jgi:acyl-CoA dehydrogenase
MDFAQNPDLELISEAVGAICAGFPDEYWSQCDQEHRFPWEFYERMAAGGWIGIAIPEQYGGGGRGIVEAVTVMRAGRSEWGGDEWVLGDPPDGVWS